MITSVLLLAFLQTIGAANNKECIKETRYGYNYDALYQLDPPAENGVELQMFVKADRDAHILFAPNADKTGEDTFVMPEVSKSIYLEVIIGGHQNTYSTIRTGYLGRMTVRNAVDTPDVLSGAEYRGFWVRLTPQNTVQVGRVQEDSPFLEAHIPLEELDVTAMSFYGLGSWSNVLGHWRIHCSEEDDSDVDVEEVTPFKQISADDETVDLKSNFDDQSDDIECMEVSRYGYNYDVMYELVPQFDEVEGNRLEFLVKAKRDAHVLFSPKAGVGQQGNFVMPTGAETEFIEVVIGGHLNGFTAVRAGHLGRMKVVQALSTPGILSGEEYRGFWVRMTPQNTVQVGRVQEDLPFLEAYIPMEELDVTAMSFYGLGSWSNVLGHWRVNCREKSETVTDTLAEKVSYGPGPSEGKEPGDDEEETRSL